MLSIIVIGNLTPNAQSHMDRSICDLTDALFTCERLYTTPIPLVYTKHTARFLLLWLITVPMALFHEFQAAKIPYPIIFVPLITFFHCIFLFGIEDLGVSIEEPFSILPMANVCTNIQNMAKELLQDSNLKLEPPAEPLPEPERDVISNNSNSNALLDLITIKPSNITLPFNSMEPLLSIPSSSSTTSYSSSSAASSIISSFESNIQSNNNTNYININSNSNSINSKDSFQPILDSLTTSMPKPISDSLTTSMPKPIADSLTTSMPKPIADSLTTSMPKPSSKII